MYVVTYLAGLSGNSIYISKNFDQAVWIASYLHMYIYNIIINMLYGGWLVTTVFDNVTLIMSIRVILYVLREQEQ